MSRYSKHIIDADWIKHSLVNEVYGPKNTAILKEYSNIEVIDIYEGYEFDNWEEFEKIHYDSEFDFEIIKRESPLQKFGVGVLYPEITEDISNPEDQDLHEYFGDKHVNNDENVVQQKNQSKQLDNLTKRVTNKINYEKDDGDSSFEENLKEDEDALALARLYKPRSFGISFAILPEINDLKFNYSGAIYRKIKTSIKSDDDKINQYVWKRIPFNFENNIDVSRSEQRSVDFKVLGLNLKLDIRVRENSSEYHQSCKIITVSVVNNEECNLASLENFVLFQNKFHFTSSSYPCFVRLPSSIKRKAENLLYHKSGNYVIGHGCSGDWGFRKSSENELEYVGTEFIPTYEVPKISPDLKFPDWHDQKGETVSISMFDLFEGNSNGFSSLNQLLDFYKGWLDEKKSEINNLEFELKDEALKNVDDIELCISRIRFGLELIKSDSTVHAAFKLMNAAMILQQNASKEGIDLTLENPFDSTNCKEKKWRPFQIAFILMNIDCFYNEESDYRDIAELIWFPTGGGKTEAYLGVASFNLFYERLKGNCIYGTSVIMRYTLRLLTSQQFERASSLICAMEYLRDSRSIELGEQEFSIGIWVGGDTTPNTNKIAWDSFNDSQKKGDSAYKFLIQKCPWCGQRMGPILNHDESGPRFDVAGFRKTGIGESKKILCHCPNDGCKFRSRLPLYFNDEELYDFTPSLVIATVDKFAQLAWHPRARSIFGYGKDGVRLKNPPSLIIQDELHLINGPLGSVFGLYETVVDELASIQKTGKKIRPKLIAATATTRASKEQIEALYAREQTKIFPPPCIDFNDSFFASIALDKDGRQIIGRTYLGVFGRSFSSALTVNTRVFSALLSSVKSIKEDRRDPWYTLLCYYNSLKELGANITIFSSDIPERLNFLRKQWGLEWPKRYLNKIIELTGRLRNSEIPKLLNNLNDKYGKVKYPVDVCLASNIIEVGVDVPRLSLMSIAGQPRGTSQYIQASGRIGRDLPGLVIVNYDTKKSRDVSHYENFRSYHEQIYSYVEAASATPYTIPVLERALSGTLFAFIRCKTSEKGLKSVFSIHEKNSEINKNLDNFRDINHERINTIYKNDQKKLEDTLKNFDRVFESIIKRWKRGTDKQSNGDVEVWGKFGEFIKESNNIQPLLRPSGVYCRRSWRRDSIETPMNMRGVDPACEAEISFIEKYDSGENLF